MYHTYRGHIAANTSEVATDNRYRSAAPRDVTFDVLTQHKSITVVAGGEYHNEAPEAVRAASCVCCILASERQRGRKALPHVPRTLNRVIAAVRVVVDHVLAWRRAMGKFSRARCGGLRHAEVDDALPLLV